VPASKSPAAVYLLGDSLVEASVACLHVEDWNLQPLGGYGCEATVGVAQDQHGVGLLFAQYGIGAGNHHADRLGRCFSRCFKEEIGFSYLQVFKKDLVQLVVVVLAGVDDQLLGSRAAMTRDRRMISGRVPMMVATFMLLRSPFRTNSAIAEQSVSLVLQVRANHPALLVWIAAQLRRQLT